MEFLQYGPLRWTMVRSVCFPRGGGFKTLASQVPLLVFGPCLTLNIYLGKIPGPNVLAWNGHMVKSLSVLRRKDEEERRRA